MGLPSITPYKMPEKEEVKNNRADWNIDPDRAVLLIHDMQQYFINAYDASQSPVKEMMDHIGEIREACKTKQIPVVYTAQPGDQDPEDRALLTDFWGEGLADDESVTKIMDELKPEESDLVLTKWRYSAFKRSDLLERMQKEGRDQLIICGVYAHIGCLMTAAEAFMSDIQSFFVADAVADFSEADHRMSMNYVATRCGMTVWKEEVLEALTAADDYSMVHKKVAESLNLPPSEVSADESLLYKGLDSIRMMSLVEELRGMGIDIDFMTMAENPTIGAWEQLIDQQTQQG